MYLNADHVIREGIERAGRAQQEADAYDHYLRTSQCLADGPSVIYSEPLDTYGLYEEAERARAEKAKKNQDGSSPQNNSLADLVVPYKRDESNDIAIGF